MSALAVASFDIQPDIPVTLQRLGIDDARQAALRKVAEGLAELQRAEGI